MEKKTIGSFIAALRKANGLTQKELAEKLNVSDKAVSRWERDECYPDLTMIPALAEIFGVSCDEFLNGGRINSEERQPRQEQKTAKQIDFLINRVRASFAVHSAGIYALSALGLLAALVCNTVFDRAYLGFFLACVFYVGGLMWLTMKLIASFSALVYETESPLLDRMKEKIVRGAAGNLTGVLIMFAAALPLIVVVNSPYYGLDISDWARYGLVFAGIAAVIGLIICAAVPRICTARGVYVPEEMTVKADKLRLKSALILVAVLVVTAAVQIALNYDTRLFADSTSFDTVDDFVAFMETKQTSGGYNDAPATAVEYDAPAYDSRQWREQHTHSIEAPDGSVVCTYIQRNENVASMSFTWVENELVSIKVITSDQLRVAWQRQTLMNEAFIAVYIVEAAVCLIVFLSKKKKLA